MIRNKLKWKWSIINVWLSQQMSNCDSTTVVFIAESVLCYQCADSKKFGDCQSDMKKFKMSVLNYLKNNRSIDHDRGYLKNCTPQWGEYCVIEHYTERGQGQAQSTASFPHQFIRTPVICSLRKKLMSLCLFCHCSNWWVSVPRRIRSQDRVCYSFLCKIDSSALA